ncbi:MAG: hypothetical protein HYY20_08485 [Candidatus Tectomicrobia bacterium]|uniref:Protein kinase domain-containing protein n=1 Tax=Tectimicrobiota bacterium TaxID=2528274 RepID=A0A932CPC3_UNCTE|nr:hypothetical protein [Candidatus Tectomicrobia bacterium]
MESLKDPQVSPVTAALSSQSARLVQEGCQQEICRRGPFQARVYLTRIAGRIVVVKDYQNQLFLFRHLVGRHLVRREERVYRRLKGCPGVPRLLGRMGKYGLILEYIPGKHLSRLDPQQLSPKLFESLRSSLEAMHRRGVVHRDIRRKNILITPNGSPFFIDFNIALARGPWYRLINRWLFRIFRQIDHKTLLKIKDSFYPGLLTPGERALLHRRFLLLSLGRFLRRRIHRKIKRRLRRWSGKR